MTVVAARKFDKWIEIASDSIACTDHRILGDRTHGLSKLFKQNGVIIGSTGDASEGGLMQMFTKNHRPAAANIEEVMEFFVEFEDWVRKRDSDFRISNQYLLVIDSEIFRTYNRLEVFQIPEFDAIGAGADFAITAMPLDKTPVQAVKVACDLSVWCNEPIINIVEPRNAT